MSFGERQSIERRINNLFLRAQKLDDQELQAEVAKYLCILASGYLEARCRDIVRKYVEPRAEKTVQNYVSRRLKRFWNPGLEDIFQLIGAFDQAKRERIENALHSSLKDAIGSIVAQRRVLAHGGNSGISLGQIQQYFSRAEQAMSQVEKVFLYDTTTTS